MIVFDASLGNQRGIFLLYRKDRLRRSLELKNAREKRA